MKPAQTLRDAAILVAVVLLATSVRVTALPEVDGPQTQAAAPIAAPAMAVPTLDADPAHADEAKCPHRQKLTVRGAEPGDVVVIEVELDPRLQAALGLCPSQADDPRDRPTDKA